MEKANSITKKDLMKLFKIEEIENYDERQHFKHDVYKLNFFDTPKNKNISLNEFLKVIKHDLEQIATFELADVIAFARGIYHHHSVLVGMMYIFFNLSS